RHLRSWWRLPTRPADRRRHVDRRRGDQDDPLCRLEPPGIRPAAGFRSRRRAQAVRRAAALRADGAGAFAVRPPAGARAAMSMSAAQRVDLWLRQGTPVALTVLLAVLSAVPIGVPGYSAVVPGYTA